MWRKKGFGWQKLNIERFCTQSGQSGDLLPSADLHLPVSFFLTVGSALSAPSVAGRCMPATGCGVLGAACTTWPVSPVSPARGSCPLGKNLAWWRAGCSVAATTTSCWKTSAGLQKTVTGIVKDVSLMVSDVYQQKYAGVRASVANGTKYSGKSWSLEL